MDTLSRVAVMAERIAERSDEIESMRSMPADMLESLVDAGCFRMLAPAEFGGDDLALPDVLDVVVELATGDGSVGWLVGQCAVAQLIVRHFPLDSVRALYASGADLLAAGAVAPKGRIGRTASGDWQVTGRWPFTSGSLYADWFYLHCMVVDGTAPVLGPHGLPETRLAILPASDVTVLDTWHVVGLRGTASNDVQVRQAVCPDERTCRLTDPPTLPGPLAMIPARDLGGLFVAAASVGIATGAVRDLVELATGGKRPAFSMRRLADSETFQDRLGAAETTLRAARALLEAEIGQAWQRAVRNVPPTRADQAHLRATGPRVVALSTNVVDEAYALAGGSAVFDGNPLQRRFRDAHAAAQHFSAGRDHYRALGAVLVDADPGIALL